MKQKVSLEKITAIIPTLNEATNIRRAIDSVSFADEIIIIDSFSDDDTVAITKEYPVRLIQRKFDDFSSQKNYAIKEASNDWVFLLDADEEINAILKEEIIKKIPNTKDEIGFYFNRDFYFMGKRIAFGGYANNKVIRLFNKKFCKYNGNLVHEKIIANGKVGQFKEPMLHWSYKNFTHYLNKVHRYKEFQAKELLAKNKRSTFLHITIKPFFRFFSHYILKLGFLDGYRGFIIAAIQGYGILIKYIYLFLYNKSKN